MNESGFWRLLDKLDWRHEGDDDRVVAPVVQELSELPLEEIKAFDQILARKLHALDGRAWAREIGTGWWGGLHPASVDQFLYARCVAIVNGREYYETVLADPSQMPKDMEFESLLYIARRAWERKTGEEPDYLTDVSYETYSNLAGWPPADPEPEVPPPQAPKSDSSLVTVVYDHGKLATRGVIRALTKGEIQDPVLSEYLASKSRVLVMTPGSGVVPPPEPDAPKNGPTPPWHVGVELWTASDNEPDRQPSGLVAWIELHRHSVEEVTARLLRVEAKREEPANAE